MSVSVVASPQPRWKARNANVLAGFFMRQFLYGLKPPGIPAVSMLGPVVRKGDVVTDFELPDETGAPRRLSGLLADGPVVLFFYPAAMSLGCTVESCHFRDLIGEFKAVGAQPVGISADRVERQRHPAIARAANKPDVSSSSLLLRPPCSIPIVEQALSYIERIECNAQWGRSILKSVGSSPIPRPGKYCLSRP